MARVFFYLILCFMCLLMNDTAHTQPSVIQDGPYQIMIMESGDIKAVYVTETKVGYSDTAMFEGACSETVDVVVATGDRRRLDVYRQSNDISDLELEPLISRLRQDLEKQCPQLNKIRISPPGMSKTVAAEMTRSSGWVMNKMSQGQKAPVKREPVIAANPGPDTLSNEGDIQLIFSDALSSAGIATRTTCSSDITLPLIKAPTGRKTPTIRDYRRFSTEVASFYAMRCPIYNVIKFSVLDLPEGVICPSGECYISAKRKEGAGQKYSQYDPRSLTDYRNWEATLHGYEFVERSVRTAPAIKDFDNMLARVEANDFSLIKDDYRGYYKLFHNQFLYAYSNKCAALIPNSVTIEYQSVETTVDGYGNEISSVETGPPEYITLERSLEPLFMMYKRANRARITQDMFANTVASRSAGKGNRGLNTTIGQLMEDRQRLHRFVAQGCQSTPVRSVYENLKAIGPIH